MSRFVEIIGDYRDEIGITELPKILNWVREKEVCPIMEFGEYDH